MSSRLDAIADALAASLNGAALSLPFTASRLALNRKELKDLAALTVTVDGEAERRAVYSRQQDRHEYDVLVAVRKQLTSIAKAEIDPLAALVDEIADHVKRLEFDDLGVARIGTEIVPYVPDDLDQHTLFTAFVRVTFEGLF